MSDQAVDATVDEAGAFLQRVVELTTAAADAVASAGRSDLDGRLRIALTRIRRPSTVICIVGEFKHGKSSLANALIGRPICPVDDDIATSTLTVLYNSDEVSVTVHRHDGERMVTESVEPERLAELVTEDGPDGTRADRVEVGFQNTLLAQGIALVDTPGMGGLGGGHGAAVQAFLPFADGLLFVSDAAAELSTSEVDFLRSAVASCPHVIYCLSKTDLHPAWRKVAALDAEHLRAAGVDLTVHPVSSALRTVALRQGSRVLNEESGFATLIRRLDSDMVRPAKNHAATRALAEVRLLVRQQLDASRAELEALRDPAASAALAEQLQVVRERLEHLRGPGAKWATVLADEVADLTSRTTFAFRNATRAIVRKAEADLDAANKSEAWQAVAERVQSDVTDAVTNAYATVLEGSVSAATRLAALLAEEDVIVEPGEARIADLSELWTATKPESTPGKVDSAVTLLGGVQSGMFTMSTLSRLMPAAAASVLLANPVVIGAGLLMGGQRLADTRKRQVTTQRQVARAGIRQFVDDVQFEIGNQLAEALRDVQRSLRDRFGDRVSELLRTNTESLQRLQEDTKRSAAEREQRIESMSGLVERYERIVAAADQLVPAAS